MVAQGLLDARRDDSASVRAWLADGRAGLWLELAGLDGQAAERVRALAASEAGWAAVLDRLRRRGKIVAAWLVAAGRQ